MTRKCIENTAWKNEDRKIKKSTEKYDNLITE